MIWFACNPIPAFSVLCPQFRRAHYTSVAVTFSSATLTFFNGTGVTISNLSTALPQWHRLRRFVSWTIYLHHHRLRRPSVATEGFGINVNLANSLTLTGSKSEPDLRQLRCPSGYHHLRASPHELQPRRWSTRSYRGRHRRSQQRHQYRSHCHAFRVAHELSTDRCLDQYKHELRRGPNQHALPLRDYRIAELCFQRPSREHGRDSQYRWHLHHPGNRTSPATAPSWIQSKERSTQIRLLQPRFRQYMIVTNLIPAATNSLIGSLSVGSKFTVNIANNPNPFFVDTKGLPVASCCPSNLWSLRQCRQHKRHPPGTNRGRPCHGLHRRQRHYPSFFNG